MRWEETKRQALLKVRRHLSSRGRGTSTPSHTEVDALRAQLDAQADCFVSLAVPPLLQSLACVHPPAAQEDDQPPPAAAAAAQPRWTTLDKEGGEPEAALTRAAAEGRNRGEVEVQARVLPLLVHVRCRDLHAAHRLLKELDGLLDVSVTSMDAAKVVVRLKGRGRPVEFLLPTGREDGEKEAVARLATQLDERLRLARQEINLAVQRLARFHHAAAAAAPASRDAAS